MMLSLPNSDQPHSANAASYLLCGLEGTLLGLDAMAVSEVVPLPAIAPVAEKSPGVQGVINLRGNIVPVLDLRMLLGFEPRAPYRQDRLVVLRYEGLMAALPVDEVHDVQSIHSNTIEVGRSGSLVAGIGRVGDEIVQLLRLAPVFRLIQNTQDALSPEEAHLSALTVPSVWKVPPEEMALFRERATALARPLGNENELSESQSFKHLAGVKLGDEYLGLDLGFVREFASLHQLTPVPCSPSFVLGLVNLRGEILTLVDVRPSLGLPPFQMPPVASVSTQSSNAPIAQIVVIEEDEFRLGLAVDEVIDVFTIQEALFTPAPSAAREEGELVLGTVLYGDIRVSVLDLPKLVALLLSQSEAVAADSIW